MKTPEGMKIVQTVHLPSPALRMKGWDLHYVMDFSGKIPGTTFLEELDSMRRVYELELRPGLADAL